MFPAKAAENNETNLLPNTRFLSVSFEVSDTSEQRDCAFIPEVMELPSRHQQ
jgi:hypothetical protein